MKLVFHGGAKEVGKSCIEISTADSRYVLDAGLKFKEHGFEAPFQIFDLQKIDGLLLSHAHLDHSGALPLFEHYNLICPVYMTEQTKELTTILLQDSYKIARIKHLHPAYAKTDIRKVLKATTTVKFDKWYTNKNAEFKFINAGHIPGSSMILMKIDGKKILYTGDFKMVDSDLMEGAAKEIDRLIASGDLKDVDVLICETTYGGKNMVSRTDTETAFLDHVAKVVETGNGSAIIPVFALGRAQDVLLSLSKRKWTVPIYLDGMCIDVTKMVLKYDDSFIKNKKVLYEMFNRRVELVKKEKNRMRVMNNRGIFITTSGMLQGGPILAYIENMWGNPNNAILLTGYQCKRTNGQLLQDEGYVYLHGWKTYVKCQVAKYGFSGHADDAQLRELITKINPKNLILDHGDAENSAMVKEWAEHNTPCKVYLPGVGDTLEF
ncbi:MAG TPA: MBL fold metallo-hydrolase [Alphaproteobacteria bacterium]|nr:MBL fold metallo-hydrolase [Alphaproteobacteria bacterium]